MRKLPILLAFLVSFAATAHAGDSIQMLPPVDEDLTTACSAGASRVLTWDGATPLTCAKDITAKNGNVGIGTDAPLGTLDIENSSGTASLCLNGNDDCVTSLKGDFKIAPTGYQVLPSGLILQWGSYTSVIGYADGVDYPAMDGVMEGWRTVTFPMQFPHAVFSLTMTPSDIGKIVQETAWYGALGTSGFSGATSCRVLYECYLGKTHTVNWFAIGW